MRGGYQESHTDTAHWVTNACGEANKRGHTDTAHRVQVHAGRLPRESHRYSPLSRNACGEANKRGHTDTAHWVTNACGEATKRVTPIQPTGLQMHAGRLPRESHRYSPLGYKCMRGGYQESHTDTAHWVTSACGEANKSGHTDTAHWVTNACGEATKRVTPIQPTEYKCMRGGYQESHTDTAH